MRKHAYLLLAAVFAFSSFGAAHRPQWSMFKGGPERTGQTDATGPQTGLVKWKRLLKDLGIQSPVAVGGDGTIYSGSVHGVFYAFRPEGSIKWKVRLGRSQITAGPAIGRDGTIYVVPENGDLHAFMPDGTLKWVFDLEGYGGPSSSPAVGGDGTVYTGADKLYAVNADGMPAWNYDTGTYIAGPAAIGRDGTIYFPSGNQLYALDAHGTLKWRSAAHLGSSLGSAPALGRDGTIYVNTNDGVLHAFRPDGRLAWTYKTEGIVMDVPASPTLGADGSVYFGGGGEYKKSGGYFYALTPQGTLEWKFLAGCDQTAAAVGGDGTIYFGSNGCGALHALRPDGTQKWVLENEFVYMRGAPAIGRNGTLYAGAMGSAFFPDQGGLFAFGP